MLWGANDQSQCTCEPTTFTSWYENDDDQSTMVCKGEGFFPQREGTQKEDTFFTFHPPPSSSKSTAIINHHHPPSFMIVMMNGWVWVCMRWSNKVEQKHKCSNLPFLDVYIYIMKFKQVITSFLTSEKSDYTFYFGSKSRQYI